MERHRARVQMREIQNVVDNPEQQIRGVVNCGRELRLLLIQRRVQQQLSQTQHGVHGRTQLVAHIGEEFALGAVGRFRREFGSLQLLSCPPLGRRHSIERFRQHAQFSSPFADSHALGELAGPLAALQLRRQVAQWLGDRSRRGQREQQRQQHSGDADLYQDADPSRGETAHRRIQRLQCHQLDARAQSRILHRQYEKGFAVALDFAFRQRLRAS